MSSSGWMEMDLEMELSSENQFSLDRGRARHGVDPPLPKVRHIWDWNLTISSCWTEVELEMDPEMELTLSPKN